jgi:hypothetical protein
VRRVLYCRRMQLRVWVVIGVVALGCSKKKEPPAAGSASGSAVAIAVDAAAGSAGTGSGSAVAAVDAGAGSAAAAPTDCLPESVPHFGRIGTELVGCTNDDATCWTIDPKTGGVKPRAAVHLPGVGFTVEMAKLKKPGCYEDLCWTVPKRERDDEASSIWVAYHPDGKRVAIIDDPAGFIFDLATKKPITTFKPDLGNSLGGLWFAGNFVVDAGFDAGPYAVLVYHDAKTGKKAGTFEDFYGGGAGVTSTGALVIASQDMTSVTVVDGTSSKGKTTKRKLPKPPSGCSPQDPGMETESDDPKIKACVAFTNKHYGPYGDVVLVDDPAGAFVGLHAGELFTVDSKLVETSRIKLKMCPPPPEEP